MAFLHLLLHAPAKPLFHLEQINLRLHDAQNMLKPLPNVSQFENLLFFIIAQCEMSRDRIGQTARILDAAEGGQHLRGDFGIEFDVLLELGRHRAHQDFSLALVELTLGYRCRINNKTVFYLNVIDDPGSTDPFDQHFDRPIRQLQQLQDIGNGPDAENALRRRIVVGCVMLGCEENLLTRLDSFF